MSTETRGGEGDLRVGRQEGTTTISPQEVVEAAATVSGKPSQAPEEGAPREPYPSLFPQGTIPLADLVPPYVDRR